MPFAMKINQFRMIGILIPFLLFMGCSRGDEPEEIPLVDLEESFYLEPGDSVMFTEPISLTFHLLRFEETEKVAGYYPYADFWYRTYTETSEMESTTRIQQSNVPEEIPFFSDCFTNFPFQDEFAPIPMRWIVEEVRFEEQTDRFIFSGVRMRFYLEADIPNEPCIPQ